MSDWGECRRRVWLQKVKHAKSTPNEPMIRGNEKHELFARLVKDPDNVKDIDLEDLEAWERVSHLARGGKAELKMAVDQDFSPVDFWADDAMIRGVIDAAVILAIYDWKMGQSKWESDWQWVVYPVIWAAHYDPQEPFIFSFVYPYLPTATGEAEAITYTIDPRELPGMQERLKDFLMQQKKEIEALDPKNKDEWEPNLSACKRCLYQAACDEYNKPLEHRGTSIILPASLTPATAPRAVEWIEKAEDLLKLAKKMLRAYCKEHGAIAAPDGRAYGLYQKPRRSIPDVEAAIKALRAADVSKEDIFQQLTLAATKAEKLATAAGVDIEDYIEETSSETLGIIP